ncbi:MAG: YhbY family RNA-binding protein [Nanoarchaeota archaeon]|nr:YhbY family RNA-binding protein [Nanoarchaeota archaeon]
MKQCSVQLGKQGCSENFMGTLESMFKNHENVKVCLLKSAGRDRDEIKEIVEKILKHLGKSYTARIVGFTIFLKKWRKCSVRY